MKKIILKSELTIDRILEVIKDSDFVNDRVKFEDNVGKPTLQIKQKNNRIRMRCEMIGGPTKDNGFLEGTYFSGSIEEKNGETVLKGIIITAPIYHTILAFLMTFFVYQCISIGGFNPVPVILLVFSFMMFKNEFKKQGIIERYLIRAFKRAPDHK